jgi:cytochrome c biogenesis protein CcmG/thiol:disulfide interchange protein DsbE
MRRNAVVILVVVLTITGMLVLGRRMASKSAAGLAEGVQPIPSQVKGIAAPDFELETLSAADGTKLKLSDLKGKAVVLSFWATWCEPCKVEMPWLVEMKKQYGAQGLEVVGIAQDDAGKEAIMKFANSMGVNYPILQGKNAVMDVYGAQLMPTTVYIGRDGKMLDKVVGLVSKSEIEDHIKQALETKP